MASNQKGAPNVAAKAVTANPKNFNNHQTRPASFQEMPVQPNGNCFNCSRALSCCSACSGDISDFAFAAITTTLSRKVEFCHRARNTVKESALSAIASTTADR